MADKNCLILVINPGSTSTKFAVFQNEKSIFEETVRHPLSDFADCPKVADQMGVRMRYITESLTKQGIKLEELSAVVGRGGIIAPMASGTYEVTDTMLKDLRSEKASIHASCLGGIIAYDLGKKYNIPAFIVDPVVVDEMVPEARLSGIPQIERLSAFHALNAKAVARLCAKDLGLDYSDARLIVCHMGGGVSTSAHRYGRAVDVINGIAGEGGFSPERCGGVYGQNLVEMAFSGQYSKEDMLAFMQKNGGLKAYLGVNDMRDVEKMVMKGDAKAAMVLGAMAYQLAKDIGTMVVALEGRVDAIVLTGGIAYSQLFTGMIKKYVDLLAPVKVYPGELEMEALAWGGLRVLRGQEKTGSYAGLDEQ